MKASLLVFFYGDRKKNKKKNSKITKIKVAIFKIFIAPCQKDNFWSKKQKKRSSSLKNLIKIIVMITFYCSLDCVGLSLN